MKTAIHYPEHITIARKSTPLQKMERLSRESGVDIYFKRDDLTGSELSGNKIRKLEFLFADAKKKGADSVITCGGAQSNHCRATALAAAGLGMDATLILRTADPKNPPPFHGNILLNCLAGAQLVWITPEEYKERQLIFEREEKRLRSLGKKPYSIPEGGSNPLGSWGYIRAMEEIAKDLRKIGIKNLCDTTVLSATGSGGTTSGLILGAKLLGLDLRVAGVNVCDDPQYFMDVIGGICKEFLEIYPHDIEFDPGTDISIIDGYVGKGYALSRPEELRAIYHLARKEGVVLDPVYTGKAFYGMIKEIEKQKNIFGSSIVFVHTGGLFGLFPIADELAELF